MDEFIKVIKALKNNTFVAELSNGKMFKTTGCNVEILMAKLNEDEEFFMDSMVGVKKLGKAGALLLKPALKEIKKKMDYTEYGGALLLGINGGIIKCHGTSKSKEIKSAILQAYEFEKANTIENIKEAIK